MRTSGTGEQPGVVAPPGTEEQLNTSPGTLPAAAVTWNEEIGSKAIPQPARTTVFPPVPGLHANPTRGASALRLLFWYQRSVFLKVTSPGFPMMGPSGTYTRPPASVGAGLISQRRP